MDELSPLFEQVRFHERWRGYDPAEVDAYVERVATAAAWARRRLEQLSESPPVGSLHHGEPVESQHGDSADPEDLRAEELARLQACAQEQAAQVIAKAEEQAAQMVADAETRVEAMTAAVNVQCTRIRREADEYAASAIAGIESRATEREAAAAATEREKHRDALAELAAQRSRQEQDLKLFERQLAGRREELEQSLSRLLEVVETAEIFRNVQAPSNEHSEVVRTDIDSTTLAENLVERSADPHHSAPRFVTLADLDKGSALTDPGEGPGAQQPALNPQVTDRVDAGGVDSGRVALPFAAEQQRDEEPFLAQLREAATRGGARTDTEDALSDFFDQHEDQSRSRRFLRGR